MKKKADLWIVPFLLYVALLGVMPQMEPELTESRPPGQPDASVRRAGG